MNYFAYFLTYFVVLSLIFIYGSCLCIYHLKDYLLYEINSHINYWVISHFIFYSFIGFFFPETFWLSFFIGINWEIYEHITGIIAKKYFYFIPFEICKLNDFTWWYGRYEDIIANTLGFLFGKYLITLF